MANKLLREKIRLVWTVILVATIAIFILTGCKPKQIIQERTITKVDSTAIVSLKSELQKKTIEVETLKTDLERFREENIKLRSDVSKHEIKYNTDAPLKPDGTYPKASETITESKTEYENTKREYLKKIDELNTKLQQSIEINTDLEQTVEKLLEENKDLKSKITPTTGFNFRLFGWGVLAGVILVILAVVIKIKLS